MRLAATLGILGVASATAFALSTETEHLTRTVPLNPGGRLQLRSFSGRVSITGTDGDQAVVDAVRRGSRDRLEHIRLDVHGDGSTVYVEANKHDSGWWLNNKVVETDFDIRVPRRTSLDVKVFSAAVNVDGVDGRHNVGGFSSRITMLNTTGSVKAHTFSGSVQIQPAGWQDRQDIDVDTFSGDITLKVPDQAAGLVSFSSFSGHLNSDVPLTFRNGRKNNLKAELGRNAESAGTLRFKTFSGSVRIDR